MQRQQQSILCSLYIFRRNFILNCCLIFAENKLGMSIYFMGWNNCFVMVALSKQHLEHQNSHEVGAVLKSIEWPKQLTGIISLPWKSFYTCDDLFMHVSKTIHSKRKIANKNIWPWRRKQELNKRSHHQVCSKQQQVNPRLLFPKHEWLWCQVSTFHFVSALKFSYKGHILSYFSYKGHILSYFLILPLHVNS